MRPSVRAIISTGGELLAPKQNYVGVLLSPDRHVLNPSELERHTSNQIVQWGGWGVVRTQSNASVPKGNSQSEALTLSALTLAARVIRCGGIKPPLGSLIHSHRLQYQITFNADSTFLSWQL